MIQVGSAKIKLVEAKLAEGIEGITFEPVKKFGLNVVYKHNGADDKTVKALLKKVLGSAPEMKNAFLSVQIVDETGKIL